METKENFMTPVANKTLNIAAKGFLYKTNNNGKSQGSCRNLFGGAKQQSKMNSKSNCFTPNCNFLPKKEIEYDFMSDDGTLRRDLFGAKQLKEQDRCESPFGSDKSSYESSSSNPYTPIQPEKIFPLSYQNDGSRHPEVNNYITNILKEDNENQDFFSYQYNHNIFSPFNFMETSLEREPLCNIPPFSLQKKLTYTECVKPNCNNFIFPYNGKNKTKFKADQNNYEEMDLAKSQKKDKLLFDTFNDSDSDKAFINSALYSPMVKCDSPLNDTSEDKQTGFKMLFSEDNDEASDKIEENIDTKWLLDIIGEPKTSPEQRVNSVSSSKDISSKAHLKSIFNNSKFTSSKIGSGKQGLASISKKLNFNDCSKVYNVVDAQPAEIVENIKEESMDIQERCYTPAPIKFIKKSLSDMTYNKESIKEVTKRLQEEVVDNPNSPSKIEYKNFAKDLKDWEKDGFTLAMKNVFDCIHNLPKKMHWRLLLDLADFAKRESEFSEATTLFKIVTHIQPYAYQGWLEHAKMEEELGNIERCRVLLKRGLKFNPLNDNLFLKCLKIEEKEGNFNEVKKMIASLKNDRIEVTYKLLLEGYLFEGRCGNIKAAQKALRFLCKRCYGQGLVFTSTAAFEERIGNIENAIKVCEEGLVSNVSFGPLWFLLIKLASKAPANFQFRYGSNIEELIEEGIAYISQELKWKLYLEAAQYQDKKDNIELARKYLKEAVSYCNAKLKWKVWIIGARIEARIGNINSAKSLIERSLYEIPSKKQSIGFLEYAKFYEFIGNMKIAYKILELARSSHENDWKVFFESVLTDVRNGNLENAEKLVKFSLKKHFVTGRLWATLIQLKHAKIKTENDSKKAFSIFRQANRKIPKSGEVWCEGARLLMSPVSHKNDLIKAEKYLNFAIQFTPQYGDSFLELFKLYTIKGETEKIKELKNTCMHSEPNYGILWFYFKNNINDTALDIWNTASSAIEKEIEEMRPIYESKIKRDLASQNIASEFWTGYQVLSRLYQKGINHKDSNLTFEEKWRNIYGFEQII